MLSIKRLLSVLLASSVLSTVHAQDDSLTSTAVYYAAKPPIQQLSQFQRVILEAGNVQGKELAALREYETQIFAYLSIGEVAPSRPWHHKIHRNWVLGTNTAWGSEVLDLTQAGWQRFVIKELVDPLVAQGYDGLFLDTLDSFQLYATSDLERQQQAHALAALLKTIKQRHPKLKLIANRGFEVMPQIAPMLEAVLAESLFSVWDNAKQEYRAAKPQDTEWLRTKLETIQRNYSLEIIIIDYMPAGKHKEARQLAKRIESLGFVPWISTPALDKMGTGLSRTTSNSGT